MFLIFLTLVISCVAIWIFFSEPTPQKIFGVYSQPGKFQFLKEKIFAAVMKHRQKKVGEMKDSAGYGRTKLNEEQKERNQPLSGHPKGIDAVYFNGASEEGNYVVAALARRPKGVFNAMFYLRLPDIGVLQLPRNPDTLLFGDEDTWNAEGLKISPKEPMKTWTISYKGKLRKWNRDDKEDENTGELFDTEVQLEYSANFKHFDFDGDCSVTAFSRSIAKENWSRQYFEDLKNAHQTHYEQMGSLRGSATVNGTEYALDMQSMRDHSYGVRREWRFLHRYALHMFHTTTGTQVNVGIVSQPITCSHLELGYMGYKKQHWKAIDRVNFNLWQFGEGGTPPMDYAFSFESEGKTHLVEVEILDAPVFFMGWEWEVRLKECFAKFKLDGVPGFGIVEYQYNKGPGDHRPMSFAKLDPEWTEQINKG